MAVSFGSGPTVTSPIAGVVHVYFLSPSTNERRSLQALELLHETLSAIVASTCSRTRRGPR